MLIFTVQKEYQMTEHISWSHSQDNYLFFLEQETCKLQKAPLGKTDQKDTA